MSPSFKMGKKRGNQSRELKADEASNPANSFQTHQGQELDWEWSP